MVVIEHADDWTRNSGDLEQNVQELLDVVQQVERGEYGEAVIHELVRGTFDIDGALQLDLPLRSGDAFWVHVGDGWARLLWIDATGSRFDVEWTWDEQCKRFLEAVLDGRVEREVIQIGARRVADTWRWRDPDGARREMRQGWPTDSFTSRVLRRAGDALRETSRRQIRIDPSEQPSAAVLDQARLALDLCRRALRIEITLEDVPRLWPDRPASPYLAEVRDDLIFALEHVPISSRFPEGDLQQWAEAVEYDDVRRHVSRLEQLVASGSA